MERMESTDQRSVTVSYAKVNEGWEGVREGGG